MYIITEWKQTDDGYQPDLPAECSYLCLAGSAWNSAFGVPNSLASLLDSAISYPPSLALAADDLAKLTPLDRTTFLEQLETLLQRRLEQQRNSRHFLAKSLIDEVGYLNEGEYVWVINYSPQRKEVTWVSSDYCIYSKPISDFDLDPTWTSERFSLDVRTTPRHQPLRIPQGWLIVYNNALYEIDPIPELVAEDDRWWIFKEDMMMLSHERSNRLLDLGWLPEGDFVHGGYVLQLYDKDFLGRQILRFETQSRLELVSKMEEIMNRVCRGEL
jgi:hypothetical protein